MRIAEAAERCGLTIDTIRYYERAGLLPQVPRGADGKRRFTAESVDWLILLGSLRKTGMSMKAMARFAALYRKGDQTIPERREILLRHAEQLSVKRRDLDRCEAVLTYKLETYDLREVNKKAEY
ncbi:MAG: MerR family transcriptional regulator [Pseudomonadota bacterium]